MPPPAIINPLTGQENSPAAWQPTAWNPATYSTPTISTGTSGVRPAGGMDLSSLTQYINSLNLGAQRAANAARIPGATALETTSSGNIASELAGQPSASTIRLLQQQAAERGAATGVGGDSPNATAAYLQALGLTSEQLQEQGQRDLSAAVGRNPGAPIFDPSTQVMTPYQSEQLNLERQRLAQEGQGGGGGYAAPRVGAGAGGGGTYSGPSTAPAVGPVSSGYIPPSNATENWWSNIGFNPNAPTGPAAPPGSPSGYYAGPNTEEDIAASLGWTGPLSPDNTTGDWSGLTNIFGPDLNTMFPSG